MPREGTFVDVEQVPILTSDAERPEIYPMAARKDHLRGKVNLDILVDEHGDVVKAKVKRSDNPVFDSAAKAALMTSVFSPALQHKVPVKLWIPATVEFLCYADTALALIKDVARQEAVFGFVPVPGITSNHSSEPGLRGLKASPLGTDYSEVRSNISNEYEIPKENQRGEATILTANRTLHDAGKPDDVEAVFIDSTLVKLILYYDLLTENEYLKKKRAELGDQNKKDISDARSNIVLEADAATRTITKTYTPK